MQDLVVLLLVIELLFAISVLFWALFRCHTRAEEEAGRLLPQEARMYEEL